MTETRSSLLRRVRDPGDAESWRVFHELYEPLLHGYVRSRGLSDDDARDVVQEVFIALLRALPTFELDRSRGRFRTWLWQVTMNAIATAKRRGNRRDRAEGGWRERGAAGETPSDDDSEIAWRKAHRRRVLEHAMNQVREQSQEKTWHCFDQHILRRRPSAEVAAELGMTANAVFVNASRVLARVRALCQEHDEDLTRD
jgi:RNA polymerase sigma-70 factor (ECF subfamily)